MISSPVDRMATIGRRQTSTSATPIAASTPVSRLVSAWPARSTVSPAVMSVPANDTPLPALTARAIRSRAVADVGVLDHHHRVGAARHHAAGRNRQRLAGPDDGGRDDAGVDLFGAEPHHARRFLGCAERVFRDHREAVDVRAVERRHVDGRDHVGGQHAPERGLERDPLGASRRQIEGGAEAALGFVPIEDLQELLLLRHRARPPRPRQPAKPSLSSPTMTKPSARVVDDSTDAPPTASGSTAPSAMVTRA